MNFKKFVLKIVCVFISMTELNLKIFILILTDEKSYEDIMIYDISYRTLIGVKLLCIRFDKIDALIRVNDATRS